MVYSIRYIVYIHIHIYTTGWRRLIGSPKLQIIFHKRATKYRSLLLEMTCKDKGSYESSPPFIYQGPITADYIILYTMAVKLTVERFLPAIKTILGLQHGSTYHKGLGNKGQNKSLSALRYICV